MAPSTPTRRTKIQRKVPSLSVGGHARVPDSVEVLSHTAVVSLPTAVYSVLTAVVSVPTAVLSVPMLAMPGPAEK